MGFLMKDFIYSEMISSYILSVKIFVVVLEMIMIIDESGYFGL